MNSNVLSETPEPFMILPLPIVKEINCTIKSCIEEYCNLELLNGENQYARTNSSDSKIDACKDIFL